MEPSREEWIEWMLSPCTKHLLIELSQERQGLLETTALGCRDDFETNQGRLKEADFVIKCINEKGG